MSGLSASVLSALALLLAGMAGASAQSLSTWSSAAAPFRSPTLAPGITQFGMPGDQQFVFCRDRECPAPSRKQRSAPPPSLPVAAAQPVTEPALAAPLPVPAVKAAGRKLRSGKVSPRLKRRCACRH